MAVVALVESDLSIIPDKSPGSSHRTPVKHRSYSALVTAFLLAAAQRDDIDRVVMFDACAGDGVPRPNGNSPWWRQTKGNWRFNTSPGINAHSVVDLVGARTHKCTPPQIHLARQLPLGIAISEAERDWNYYETLVDNCHKLPGTGYFVRMDERDGYYRWRLRKDNVYFIVQRHDSRQITLADLLGDHPIERTAFLINHDPPKVEDWALHPKLREALTASPFHMLFHALGYYKQHLDGDIEKAIKWWRHVYGQLTHVPDHHDVHSWTFDKDRFQWQYLIDAPESFLRDTARMVDTAFVREGFKVHFHSRHLNPDRFKDVMRERMTTAKMRKGRR